MGIFVSEFGNGAQKPEPADGEKMQNPRQTVPTQTARVLQHAAVCVAELHLGHGPPVQRKAKQSPTLDLSQR